MFCGVIRLQEDKISQKELRGNNWRVKCPFSFCFAWCLDKHILLIILVVISEFCFIFVKENWFVGHEKLVGWAHCCWPFRWNTEALALKGKHSGHCASRVSEPQINHRSSLFTALQQFALIKVLSFKHLKFVSRAVLRTVLANIKLVELEMHLLVLFFFSLTCCGKCRNYLDMRSTWLRSYILHILFRRKSRRVLKYFSILSSWDCLSQMILSINY